MPFRTCLTCGDMVALRDVAAHQGNHREATRFRDPFYRSAAWRRMRSEQLAREPYCRRCGAAATDVDHIVRRRVGGPDDAANLQSLCGTCHKAKTARETFHGG